MSTSIATIYGTRISEHVFIDGDLQTNHSLALSSNLAIHFDGVVGMRVTPTNSRWLLNFTNGFRTAFQMAWNVISEHLNFKMCPGGGSTFLPNYPYVPPKLLALQKQLTFQCRTRD